VFSTAATATTIGWIAEVLRPYGHLSAIDLTGPVNLEPLVRKSLSLHTEMVFSKITAGVSAGTQGGILAELAEDAVTDRLRPIVTTNFDGLTADTMRKAHELVESGGPSGRP
jgi:NADPH:quinone reductase